MPRESLSAEDHTRVPRDSTTTTASIKLWTQYDHGCPSWCNHTDTRELAHSHHIHVVIDGDDGGVDMRVVHEDVEAALRLRTLYAHPCNTHPLSSDVPCPDRKAGCSHPCCSDRCHCSLLGHKRDVASPDALPRQHHREQGNRADRAELTCEGGIYHVEQGEHRVRTQTTRTYEQFIGDVQQIKMTVAHEVCVRACAHRLGIIEERSRLAFLRNSSSQQGYGAGRAGAVTVRVDTLVQLGACADAADVARYVMNCCTQLPNTNIRLRSGAHTTLGRLLQAGGIRHARELSCEGQPWWMTEQEQEEEDGYECVTNSLGHNSITGCDAGEGCTACRCTAQTPKDGSLSEWTHRCNEPSWRTMQNNTNSCHPHELMSHYQHRHNCTAASLTHETDLRSSISSRALHAELCFTFLNIHGSLAPPLLKRRLDCAEPTQQVTTTTQTRVKAATTFFADTDACAPSVTEAGEYGIPFYASHLSELGLLATRLQQTQFTTLRQARWVLCLRPFERSPVNMSKTRTCPRTPNARVQFGGQHTIPISCSNCLGECIDEESVTTVQDQLDALFKPMIRATLREKGRGDNRSMHQDNAPFCRTCYGKGDGRIANNDDAHVSCMTESEERSRCSSCANKSSQAETTRRRVAANCGTDDGGVPASGRVLQKNSRRRGSSRSSSLGETSAQDKNIHERCGIYRIRLAEQQNYDGREGNASSLPCDTSDVHDALDSVCRRMRDQDDSRDDVGDSAARRVGCGDAEQQQQSEEEEDAVMAFMRQLGAIQIESNISTLETDLASANMDIPAHTLVAYARAKAEENLCCGAHGSGIPCVCRNSSHCSHRKSADVHDETRVVGGASQAVGVCTPPPPSGDPGSASHKDARRRRVDSVLYYYYYIHANLSVLNRLRQRKGLSTIQLRAGCNPRGGMTDICAAYLVTDVITRATKLVRYPVLQYLCGLHAVGLAVSPLADHVTGVMSYAKHPLPSFLNRCLSVTLATEAPLYYHHHSTSPLTEEYATAKKVMRLSGLDVAELAHNSVCISTFSAHEKNLWLGLSSHSACAAHCSSAIAGGCGGSCTLGSSAPSIAAPLSSPLANGASTPGTNSNSAVAAHDYTTLRKLGEINGHLEVVDRLRFRSTTWQLERELMRDLHLDRGLLRCGTIGNIYEGAASTAESATLSTLEATVPCDQFGDLSLRVQRNAPSASSPAAPACSKLAIAAPPLRRRSQWSHERWHYLSSVEKVEYNVVVDGRVRFPRTILSRPMMNSCLHNCAAAAASAATFTAVSCIIRALELRKRYYWVPPKPWERPRRRRRCAGDGVEADFIRHTDLFNEDEWRYASSGAVYMAYPSHAVHTWPPELPTLDAFYVDVEELKCMCGRPEVKHFAHSRLENLNHMFSLHLALNHANEAGTTECRASSNRDIYQATKVDTHIHMAAGMTPRQMLRFVLQKLHDSADDIALKKGDEIVTLGELFAKAGITDRLTVDQLNVQADHTLFERFDNFNGKYNPMANADLRSLLLKTDNFMNGRYFAEIIREVFSAYSRDRHTFAENRLSIYGTNLHEWDKLSSWFVTHGMSDRHNKWIIQIPRVYKVFRAQNVIGSFGQYLQNLFQPLWDASMHPAQHPTLHNFLNHISGFDSVDNESAMDSPFMRISPWAWTFESNPPYNYYLYYLYANIRTLNTFRALRGFSTFTLRPHCGESGSEEHLYGAFLCANSICHGINLHNDPAMQYLYYLTQIGLHMSPVSNNALFLRFLNNPFPKFFRRGLNVSLSTDDPMMFHQTHEPLIEEYSIAARVWGLSANDLCELARNSVLQSGFDDAFKRERIGTRWYMSSSLGNDPMKTHLSDIRVAFRYETYHSELAYLHMYRPQTQREVPRFMMTIAEEREINERDWADTDDEQVILSTDEQAMEIMQRDMERTRHEVDVQLRRVEAARRLQRLLLDSIADVRTRRKEALDRLHDTCGPHHTRQSTGPVNTDCLEPQPHNKMRPVDGGGCAHEDEEENGLCCSRHGEMTYRLPHWSAASRRDVLPTLRHGGCSAVAKTGRPLPPLPTQPPCTKLR